MSKIGRYSADRKKVKVIDGDKDAYTITVAECGTIFGLTSGSGGKESTTAISLGYGITLPKLADAGPGWWCKFVVGVDGENRQDITISAHDDDGSTMTVTRTAMSGGQVTNQPAGELISGEINQVSALNFSEGNSKMNDTLELVAWVDVSDESSNAWLGNAILSKSLGLTAE